MKVLSAFLKIIDAQTVIVTLLAVASTYICNQFEFFANLPSGLIGIAIIFPIVFSINSAYRRREEALKYFASLKAHAAAISYAHRDWVPEDSSHLTRAIELKGNLLNAIRDYFSASADKEADQLRKVYDVFSNYSSSHETLRHVNVATGEISRINQYLRSMIIEFERMRNILQYRTPISLRAYSQVFLNIFPILFGPYFAKLCNDSYMAIGYGVAVIYSIVLVSLDNIQEDLENPFDSKGEDDVDLDVAEQYRLLLDTD
jgi:predicted membrane chloride channel (bestrophin family)